MEAETMGRVVTEATLRALRRVGLSEQGSFRRKRLGRVSVPDALVDTGATLISLPTHLIRQLGLSKTSTKRVNSSVGPAEANVYEAVRLTIQGRSCTMDVLEVPDTVPVLIGQIPLEHLDLVIDMRGHALIGNPAARRRAYVRTLLMAREHRATHLRARWGWHVRGAEGDRRGAC